MNSSSKNYRFKGMIIAMITRLIAAEEG